MAGRSESEDAKREITRRDVLVRGAAAGLTVTAGSLLAACGGGAKTSGLTGGSPASGVAKKGGILRVGIPGGSSANSVDPNKLFVTPDFLRAFNLYDGFTYANSQFTAPENRLAEEFTSNRRGDVWTMRLKDGVEFHNGKKLTADDAIFTVQRILDPKQASPGASLLGPFIDPKGMKKLDARTVRFTLTTPFPSLPTLFANWSVCYVVPVGYDPKHPIGTGPFKYVSFTPGSNSRFVAFDNYWGGRPHVDELRFIDLPDDSARMNALQGGQVDAIASVPFAQIATLKSNPSFQVLEAPSSVWHPMRMQCRTEPANPFSDVRVRQAFRLLVNRQQLIDQAYLGHGRVGNDLMSITDSSYAKFPQRNQDIQQAKSLLSQAGKQDYAFAYTASNLGPGAIEFSTGFVQQVNSAGIKMQLQEVDSSVWAGPNYLKWPLANDYWPGVLGYLAQVALSVAPNAGYDETGFGDVDHQYAALYREALRTPDASKRLDIEHEMQKIEYESGAFIIWSFQNIVDAASTKLTGFVTDNSGWSLASGNLKNVSFK